MGARVLEVMGLGDVLVLKVLSSQIFPVPLSHRTVILSLRGKDFTGKRSPPMGEATWETFFIP